MNSKFLCCLAVPGNKGFCVPLPARRSLRPAHDAAATLLRFREDARDAAGSAPAARAAPDGGSAAGASGAGAPETDQRAPLEPRGGPGVPRQRTVSEPAGAAAAQGRAAWADAAAGGGAVGAAAPPRRIRSYPLALGAEGAGGPVSPDPDPNPATGPGSGCRPGSAGAATAAGAGREPAPAPKQATVGSDAGGGERGRTARAAARGASSERQAGGGALGAPAPWTGGAGPAGGGALLGSPARGPFSELRRGAAQEEGPERAVELSRTLSSTDHAGLRASDGGAADGSVAQNDGGGSPRGAAAGGEHGVAGLPEGLRGLRVLGAEAHSRCVRGSGLRRRSFQHVAHACICVSCSAADVTA